MIFHIFHDVLTNSLCCITDVYIMLNVIILDFCLLLSRCVSLKRINNDNGPGPSVFIIPYFFNFLKSFLMAFGKWGVKKMKTNLLFLALLRIGGSGGANCFLLYFTPYHKRAYTVFAPASLQQFFPHQTAYTDAQQFVV